MDRGENDAIPAGTRSGLFPLRLTPFEEYMFIDDRRQYPMAFFIEIGLSGDLRRDVFDAALKQALLRHPLLTARIETGWKGPHWIDAGLVADIQWFDGAPELPGPDDRSFDLRREAGLRIWGGAGGEPEQSRIIFQFHHAATDGVGALQFIGDLLAYYGQATCLEGEETPELAEIDPELLRFRGQIWEPGHGHPRLMSSLLWWCWQVLPVIPTDLAKRAVAALNPFPKPQPTGAPDQEVAAAGSEESLPKAPGPFVTRILGASHVMAIKHAAAAKGVTPNEIYIQAMFQTLQRWNRQCGRTVDLEAYRVGIPVGLRTPRHSDSPAANILSYMFLTQHSKEMRDSEQQLLSIHRMSHHVLNGGDSGLIPWSLGIIRWFPGLLKLIVRSPVRFCTAMLANVADVRRQLRCRFPLSRGRCVAGNVVLESLLGAAPIRPGTYLGLSLGTYAKKLYINLNCDPRRFSVADANAMADLFVNRVEELCTPVSLNSAQPQIAE